MTTDELADDIAARQADDDRLRNPAPVAGEWWERCRLHGWYRPFSVVDADCGTCRTDAADHAPPLRRHPRPPAITPNEEGDTWPS